MANEVNNDEIQDELQNQSSSGEPFQDITNNYQIVPANNDTQQVEQATNQVAANATYISTGLLEYLKSKSEGKAILNHYENAKKKSLPLNTKIRNRLSRLVIAREKDHILKNVSVDEQLEKFIILKGRFEVLADEIANIFKYECAATYFTAYVQTTYNSKKVTVIASGKLWNHYNYTKKKLKDDHLLREKLNGRPTNILSNEELEDALDADHIEWLSSHIEPWDDVFEKWTLSFKLRRLMLIQSTLSVFDYMNKFPCLKTQDAKQLFDVDFELLFPDKPFIETDRWVKVKNALITSLNIEAKITSKDDSILLGLLTSGDLSSEKEEFILFYLLNYILKPKRKTKRKRGEQGETAATSVAAKKLSVEESRESFILRVEAANHIESRLENLKRRYREDGETFQPVIVAVGSPSRINRYHVIVNDQMFDVEKILEAIELALKIFFALDCEYPSYTKTIWVFLHKILFNIDLPGDEMTVDGTALIGQLKQL